jgi:preprotein translocase subunit SecA
VLNAKNHEYEAQIIAQAGRLGAVTVATNMAGRGVDIILGGNPPDPEEAARVRELGGLCVIGTERHEARRIDNQLRGRSGRQGDPGESRFYVSLEDDLMRSFGYEKVAALMERLGLPDDMPIEHPLISRTIETAQRQIESHNFNIRKHLLEYDDVLNKQREYIYGLRQRILEKQDIEETVAQYLDELIDSWIATFIPKNSEPDYWDVSGLAHEFEGVVSRALDIERIGAMSNEYELKDYLIEEAQKALAARREALGDELFAELERILLLQNIDYWWREQLYDMDYLREGINLRAYGQKDPLVEYKIEAFQLFNNTLQLIKENFFRYLFHVEVVTEEAPAPAPARRAGAGAQPVSRKVGRNDPCPCGSGKKYKKCCGRAA